MVMRELRLEWSLEVYTVIYITISAKVLLRVLNYQIFIIIHLHRACVIQEVEGKVILVCNSLGCGGGFLKLPKFYNKLFCFF